jgi:hypothetical protein
MPKIFTAWLLTENVCQSLLHLKDISLAIIEMLLFSPKKKKNP